MDIIFFRVAIPNRCKVLIIEIWILPILIFDTSVEGSYERKVRNLKKVSLCYKNLAIYITLGCQKLRSMAEKNFMILIFFTLMREAQFERLNEVLNFLKFYFDGFNFSINFLLLKIKCKDFCSERKKY